MHHFAYRGGTLHGEAVDLARVAADVGTPFYCYSSATLERHYRVLDEAFAGTDHLICYSVKANSNIAVIATLAALGSGVDIVSEGELHRARAAGVATEQIVFSGVGKTAAEIAAALDAEILCFNVESEPELALLSEIASQKGVTAPVSFRINPDVDAGTHHKIATGRSGDKFGIALPDARRTYAAAARLPGLRVTGVDMHIGSQITDLGPFENAFAKLAELVVELRADGHKIDHVDLGGGLGVPYRHGDPEPPDPDAYGAMARRHIASLGCRIILEPGRMIAANAGVLVARVLYVKQTPEKTFIIVDSAMNDLVRPTLYEAHHDILPLREPAPGTAYAPADVVGPVCETGDYLALDRPLPVLQSGDLIAFMTAGAYGAALSSTYNTRPLVPEVMVHDDEFAVVRARPSYEQMLAAETVPAWIKA